MRVWAPDVLDVFEDRAVRVAGYKQKRADLSELHIAESEVADVRDTGEFLIQGDRRIQAGDEDPGQDAVDVGHGWRNRRSPACMPCACGARKLRLT